MMKWIIIYVICVIILLIVTTLSIKSDPEDAKRNARIYTTFYLITFIPIINIIVVILFFIGVLVRYTSDLVIKIIGIFIKQEKKKIEIRLNEAEKYKLFKQGMIDIGMFKDQTGIEDFINGIRVANALINDKGGK